MTKVLLTGASGYIGKHIALELLNQGFYVKASIRSMSRAQEVKDAVAPHLHPEVDLETHLSFVELNLNEDAGWNEALQGVDVLMHTASPFPIASPEDEDELIRPAVDGTLRALCAAKSAGVNRVILTSSNAAVFGYELPSNVLAFDETMWTDTNSPIGKVAYTKSKTLAEKAAWDYVATEALEINLTTINPVLVLGAPLDINFGSSVSLVERILRGKDPLLPDIRFGIVDVRDVAKMHVSSIDLRTTFGQRILASSETLSFVEIAQILKKTYPDSKVKTGKAPTSLIKFLSSFNSDIKAVLPLLGKAMITSNSKAQLLLGISFVPAAESVKETAAFLFESETISR